MALPVRRGRGVGPYGNDDPTGELRRPVDPARPRIDPRMARRVVEVRRAEGRRRLRLLLSALGVLGAVVIAAGVLESPLGRVRHLRVTGAGPLPAGVVAAAAGVGADTPMITYRVGAAAARLDALPLVATATVRREWPSTVRITLTLRRPVAVVAAGARVATVDATGRVLAVASAGPGVPALPTLLGAAPAGAPGASAPVPGSTLATGGTLGAELALATTAAEVLPAATAARITSIATGPAGLVATVVAPAGPAAGSGGTPGGGAGAGGGGRLSVRFGPPADTTTRAAQVAALAAVLAAHPPPAGSTLDLDVPERPVVVTAAPLTATTAPASVSTQARG